jgi:hypothetical protein
LNKNAGHRMPVVAAKIKIVSAKHAIADLIAHRRKSQANAARDGF